MTFARSARFYDHLYSGKDYAGASRDLHSLLTRLHPSASSLLDVGCGTGRHLEHLRRHYAVEGLDLNPELLDIARTRCPGVRFHEGDMTDFALEARFDVITCLFSAIGYARTLANLRRAVCRMAHHLRGEGVIVIEPWFTPEQYWTGTITANFVDEPDLKIAWMYTSERRDLVSVLDVHYLVGTARGIDHFTERHEFGLFTHAEYLEALRASGLEPDHDPRGLFGRGLYWGVRPPTAAPR